MATQTKDTKTNNSKSKIQITVQQLPDPKPVKAESKDSMLSTDVLPSSDTSLARIKQFSEGLQRIREAIRKTASSSPSSEDKPKLSEDDQAILYQLYLSLIPRSSTKNEIKCFTYLAGNIAADNTAGSVAFIINSIQNGSGKNQRIGTSVRMVRMLTRARGVARSIAQVFSSQEGGTYRNLIVYDKMTQMTDVLAEVIASGNATTANAGVLVAAGNAGLTEGLPHPVTTHTRYEHLHDETIQAQWQMIPAGTAGTQATTIANVFAKSDVNMHGRRTDFFNTTGTPFYGSVNWFMIADADQDAVLALTYEMICNIYYVDN